MGRIISTSLLTKMVFILMVYFLITGLYEYQYAGKEFDLKPIVQGSGIGNIRIGNVTVRAPEGRYANMNAEEALQIIGIVEQEYNTEPSLWDRVFGSYLFNPQMDNEILEILNEVERMNQRGDIPYVDKVAYVENQARVVFSKYYERKSEEEIAGTAPPEEPAPRGGILGTIDAIGGFFSNLAQAVGQVLTIIGKALTFDISVPAEYEPFIQYVRWVVAPAVIIPFSLVLIELLLALFEVIGGLIPFT
ncbi:MAG: hypothetical protein SVE93_00165 [Candidatus Thermoplasmatota archaeon]|nr:hypothetical protein [Candidatus Thermoplasmatota archaeon]